ncbi:GMC oxidoreductase [Ruegeria arenilitoris]|uniref:GMC oxidoreductase n=1 Tax=Ruegeria arenilitoris TaxID=1173585 RepID=UPI001481A4C2|nr:GMC oxidoreductase [Ruegeria arenilitoris]
MRVLASEVDFNTYDVIVAGSGLASYAMAKRLGVHGKSAIMLETGEAQYNDDIQSDFAQIYGRGHLDGSHWPLHWVRAMGGTSAVWAGYCSPLIDRNFRQWPITRSDLNPYYKIAAGYLGRPDPFLTYSSAFEPGFVYRPISTEDPLRLIREPQLYDQLPATDLALGATLSHLHPREDRQGIEAISIYTLDGGTRRIDLRPGQVVVLAAGAMGNAQILLSSQSETGPAVGNENDQVGRYLMEHPHFPDCAKLIGNGAFQFPTVPEGFGELTALLEPDQDLYRQIGELEVSVALYPGKFISEDPVETMFASKWGDGAVAYGIIVRAEMDAEPENRVTVREGTDPAGLRKLRTDFHIGARSFRAVDTFLETLGERLIAADTGRLRMSNEEIMFGVTGGGHTLGTTRMGANPKTSVVDADCRVHRYQNLFVAGSSVFASGGHANPTLTIMALAARLGDKLGVINEV